MHSNLQLLRFCIFFSYSCLNLVKICRSDQKENWKMRFFPHYFCWNKHQTIPVNLRTPKKKAQKGRRKGLNAQSWKFFQIQVKCNIFSVCKNVEFNDICANPAIDYMAPPHRVLILILIHVVLCHSILHLFLGFSLVLVRTAPMTSSNTAFRLRPSRALQVLHCTWFQQTKEKKMFSST